MIHSYEYDKSTDTGLTVLDNLPVSSRDY